MNWLFRMLAGLVLMAAPVATCASPVPVTPGMAMGHHDRDQTPCHRPDLAHPCPMTSCCAIAPDMQAAMPAPLIAASAPSRPAPIIPPTAHTPAIHLPPPRTA